MPDRLQPRLRAHEQQRQRPDPDRRTPSRSNGQPASFEFVQPTYPGDPNGQNDPDPARARGLEREPRQRDEPEPAGVLAAGQRQRPERHAVPGQQARHHAVGADRGGRQLRRATIDYTGRPGVHVDGDGSTEGWFRVNTTAAPNDGSFVTTEPVGTASWMPAQQPSEREADLRLLRHGAGRQDRDRQRRARRRDDREHEHDARADDRQPAGRELPRGLVDVALALAGADRELPRREQHRLLRPGRAHEPTSGITYYQAQASAI